MQLKRAISIPLAVALVAGCLILLVACDAGRKTEGAQQTDYPVVTGLTYSSCKADYTDRSAAPAALETCLAYEYDGISSLALTQSNLWANCCLMEITAGVVLVGDTIFIIESEILEHPCRCICLYDLNLTVDGIPPGIYHIRVDEIYGQSSSTYPPLAFIVDLSRKAEGKFCVER